MSSISPFNVSSPVHIPEVHTSSGSYSCEARESSGIKEGKGSLLSSVIEGTQQYFYLTAAHNLPSSWRTDAPLATDSMSVTIQGKEVFLLPPQGEDVFYDDFCDVALVPLSDDPVLAMASSATLSVCREEALYDNGDEFGSLIRPTYVQQSQLGPGYSGVGLTNAADEVFCVHSQRELRPEFLTGEYERRGTGLSDIWGRVNNGNQRTRMWHVLSQFVDSSEWVEENPDLQARREADFAKREAEMAYYRNLLGLPAEELEGASCIVEETSNRLDKPLDLNSEKGRDLESKIRGILAKFGSSKSDTSEIDIVCKASQKDALLNTFNQMEYSQFRDNIKPYIDESGQIEYDYENEDGYFVRFDGEFSELTPPFKAALTQEAMNKGKSFDVDRGVLKEIWRLHCEESHGVDYKTYMEDLQRGRYVCHDEPHTPKDEEKKKGGKRKNDSKVAGKEENLHEMYPHIHLHVKAGYGKLEKLTFVLK